MDTFIQFISELIYGQGVDAPLTPNHRTFVAGTPSGTEWLEYYVVGPGSMLGVYEAWQAARSLPPIYPWDGSDYSQWDPEDRANAGVGIALPAALNPTNLTLANEDALGVGLRDRLVTLQTAFSLAGDLQDAVKAPYSHRFWGYLKWASLIVRRFNGELVDFDPPLLYDRDGTILTAIPFLNFVNDAHWNWHDFDGMHSLPFDLLSPRGEITPGYSSPVGQRAHANATTMAGQAEEFLYFHRDHVKMFHNWLARTGQSEVRGINLLSVFTTFGAPTNRGWPPNDGAADPDDWIPTDNPPWTNAEEDSDDGSPRLLDFTTRAALAGPALGAYHAQGHNSNFDIRHPFMNNYVPRFFAWHQWLDDQWRFREPRFSTYDAATGRHTRIFRPVLVTTGTQWPSRNSLTVVRDPAAAADALAPMGSVGGIDFGSGEGTLRMQFIAADTYGRALRLDVTAEVFDATDAVVETVTATRLIGPGEPVALGTEFEVDLPFASAFRSDDPGRAEAAVGFDNSRIRVSATLAAADGTDTGFIHEDFVDIQLVRERQAPDIDVFLNLSSFSQDQVAAKAAEPDGSKRFRDAVIVTVQDRTERAVPLDFSEVIPELRGVLAPPVPAAGLFDDVAHAMQPQILQPTVDTPFSNVTVELASGPAKEDPTLPDDVSQRFTYTYDIVFGPGHTAFAGLAEGAEQFGRLRLETADRAGNAANEQVPIKFFRDANPYMVDGDPSWLSDDTRVLRVFDGDSIFGVTLSAADPNAFITALITRLNDTAIPAAERDAFLTSLPTFNGQDVLEYSTTITTPATGATRAIFNFALARIRVQGQNGADRVRAFFRLFTYSAANLVFDDGTASPDRGGYRTHTDGLRRTPLLGFAASGEVTSIPFFAVPRVSSSVTMRDQAEDTPNVQDFAAGSNAEQVRYFGAYLDINQDAARLPAARVADPLRIDGGFTTAEVQPIRTLIHDAHQCMVVEVMMDGDATQLGTTPSTSDNLAQRNITILTSDNPGSAMTRTVEHSFEAQTDAPHDKRLTALLGDGLRLLTPAQADRARRHATARTRFGPTAAVGNVTHAAATFPRDQPRVPGLVFDAERWTPVGRVVDELAIFWNGLPPTAKVELYLPGVRAETVMNLRKLRHAPDDVRIIDEHRLRLTPGTPTFIPLPPTEGGRVNGTITITLPEGVKHGQGWLVDAMQIRGATKQALGAFRLDIRVDKDVTELAAAQARLLDVLVERRSLRAKGDRWLPILNRRIATARARARALSERAGVEFNDPTVWQDPDRPGVEHEMTGPRVRVVLERIEVLRDFDPSIKGAGEMVFFARVQTPSNGGQDTRTRIPDSGVCKISDVPGHNVVEFNQTLFAGYASEELRIELVGTEKDCIDPDDWTGKCARVLSGPADGWFGDYGPQDAKITPEDVGPWRVWYRIERGGR